MADRVANLTEAVHQRTGLTAADITELATAELPSFLERQRWFGGKARRIRSLSPVTIVPLAVEPIPTVLCVVLVRYETGAPDHYAVPLALAQPERLQVAVEDALASVQTAHGELLVCDGLPVPESRAALVEAIRTGVLFRGEGGAVRGFVTGPGRLVLNRVDPTDSFVPSLEQSNSAVLYGRDVFLKLFRRLVPGPNPDVEVGRFLTEVAGFKQAPAVYGGLELCVEGYDEPWSLALAQQALNNVRGDAWQVLGELLRDRARQDSRMATWQETYQFVEAVADCTAALHRALASGTHDPAFRPVAADASFLGELIGRVERECRATLELLRASLGELGKSEAALARRLLERAPRLLAALDRARTAPLQTPPRRIRVHGDYHLGQLLVDEQGKFYVIDFEGEPARPLAERRRKELVLKDVAGLLRSIDYAANAVAFDLPEAGSELTAWADRATALFWQRYLAAVKRLSLVPPQPQQQATLRAVYLIEKACYELVYELNNRPDWVRIPLAGLNRITEMLDPS